MPEIDYTPNKMIQRSVEREFAEQDGGAIILRTTTVDEELIDLKGLFERIELLEAVVCRLEHKLEGPTFGVVVEEIKREVFRDITRAMAPSRPIEGHNATQLPGAYCPSGAKPIPPLRSAKGE